MRISAGSRGLSRNGGNIHVHPEIPFITIRPRIQRPMSQSIPLAPPEITAKERDNETGLDFFEARFYSSTQARFTSPDPLLSSGRTFAPQSWNRYSYVLNNPLSLIDPTGLADENPDDQKKE